HDDVETIRLRRNPERGGHSDQRRFSRHRSLARSLGNLESVAVERGFVASFSLAEKAPSRDSARRLSGGIAQLVERLVRNEKARGSNPLTSSSFPAAMGQ